MAMILEPAGVVAENSPHPSTRLRSGRRECSRSTARRPRGPTPGRTSRSRELAWLEPYPDTEPELPDGYGEPDACYEQRESVELAFIAASRSRVTASREIVAFVSPEQFERFGLPAALS